MAAQTLTGKARELKRELDSYARLLAAWPDHIARCEATGDTASADMYRRYQAEAPATIARLEAEYTAIKATLDANRAATRSTAPRSASIYSDLPRIVAVLDVQDYGEGAAASCPHCGAEGRYIYTFQCEDGTTRGAMRGCFARFPQHPFAKRHAALIQKEKDYTEKGWTLASWDQDILAAIHDFASGTITEQQAQDRIRAAERRAADYRERKFGRRSA